MKSLEKTRRSKRTRKNSTDSSSSSNDSVVKKSSSKKSKTKKSDDSDENKSSDNENGHQDLPDIIETEVEPPVENEPNADKSIDVRNFLFKTKIISFKIIFL